jgi:ferredoxin
MTFSDSEFTTSPDKVTEEVSKEEALSILRQSEEIGLVHTVNNVMEGLGFVCNCCSCCCLMLRGIKDWGIEKSVAFANYYAVVDPEQCNGCGVCVERCQVNAISEKDGIAVVHRERCIGCGLCATGCPSDAPELHRKPESEIVNPPVDFEAWEQERLLNRGLLEYRDRRMLRDG